MTAATRPAQAARAGRLPRFGPTAQILCGLALGVLVGLFFGEPAAALQPIANVYIRLMQMTVLPYLVVSLIAGIGELDATEVKRLAVRCGLLLVAFWVLALVVIGVMPLAFPRFESASFFSNAWVEPKRAFALTEIYVPANPFNALSNTIVPSVVLFVVAVGVALIVVPNKDMLITNLRTLDPLKLPAGIAMRKSDRDLADFVNAWLVIRKSSGALDRAYSYWGLGKGRKRGIRGGRSCATCSAGPSKYEWFGSRSVVSGCLI